MADLEGVRLMNNTNSAAEPIITIQMTGYEAKALSGILMSEDEECTVTNKLHRQIHIASAEQSFRTDITPDLETFEIKCDESELLVLIKILLKQCENCNCWVSSQNICSQRVEEPKCVVKSLHEKLMPIWNSRRTITYVRD